MGCFARSGGGPKPKLSLEDRLLLALDYWREYCAFFHVAGNFGVSESSAIRTTHWEEEVASLRFPSVRNGKGTERILREC